MGWQCYYIYFSFPFSIWTMDYLFLTGRLYDMTENTQKSCSCCEIGINIYKIMENWYVSYYYWFVHYKQTLKQLYFPDNQLPPRAMIFLILIDVALISCTLHSSQQVTDHEYPLMHYTHNISEEHFTAERPLVIVLLLAEEYSSNKEVEHLIEALNKSVRRPILVFNVTDEINGNVYTEIHQHFSYIILKSWPSHEWNKTLSDSWNSSRLFMWVKFWESWNPMTRFVVLFMANCTCFESKNISQPIRSDFWTSQVSNPIAFS
jgi:hypothetical protein